MSIRDASDRLRDILTGARERIRRAFDPMADLRAVFDRMEAVCKKAIADVRERDAEIERLNHVIDQCEADRKALAAERDEWRAKAATEKGTLYSALWKGEGIRSIRLQGDFVRARSEVAELRARVAKMAADERGHRLVCERAQATVERQRGRLAAIAEAAAAPIE